MIDLEYTELYPQIIVYKNMLKDSKKAYNTLLNSEKDNGNNYLSEWTPWATFGMYAHAKDNHELNGSENGEQFDAEKELEEEISDSYKKALTHYSQHYNITFPENSEITSNSYCKYFANLDTLKNNLTMQYHTDYNISEKDMPGPKFHTTCTFYINDNYDGGDVQYYINGDVINYKPEAGSIVIFPSSEPYWHGVKTITNGNKYFIRNFVVYPYDGNPEWLEKQKLFGAVRWMDMEKKRLETEIKNNMLYIKDGKIVTHDDYYAAKQEQEQ